MSKYLPNLKDIAKSNIAWRTNKNYQDIDQKDVDREVTKLAGKDGFYGKGAKVSKPIYKSIAIIFLALLLFGIAGALLGN